METYAQHTVVCPYCGHNYEEPWDLFGTHDECAEEECDECGRTFEARRYEPPVEYSTKKPDGPHLCEGEPIRTGGDD